MKDQDLSARRLKLAIVLTHPVQYYSPWFAHIAQVADLTVFYAHRQTSEGQAAAGFSTAFSWDVPLLEGYHHVFLKNVARRPRVGHFLGANTPEVTKLVRDGSFDALVTFGWNRLCYLQAWRGALAARIPIFVRLDSQLSPYRPFWRRAAKSLLWRVVLPRVADYLSPGTRSDAYLAHYGVPTERTHRVPHMVDTTRFANGAEAARANGTVKALRNRHGACDDTIVFLQVGKLIPIKQPLVSVEALTKLEPSVRARVQLWFVGDGPLEEEVATFAAAKDLPVRRLGFVNQSVLPGIYASADVLLLPSFEETWGLVVNEAQACGLPVIASEGAGCAPELVSDGVTGWIFRGGDASELARLMTEAASSVRELPDAPIKKNSQCSSYVAGTEALLSAVARVIQRRASPSLKAAPAETS